MEHKQLLKLTREMKEKFADVLHRTLPERNVLKPEVGDNLQMTKFLEDLAVKKYSTYNIGYVKINYLVFMNALRLPL